VDCKAAGAYLQPSRSSVGSSDGATVSITGNLERILRIVIAGTFYQKWKTGVVMEEIKSEVKQRCFGSYCNS